MDQSDIALLEKAKYYKEIEWQEQIEARYNRHLIDKKIRAEIEASDYMQALIAKGEQLLLQWAAKPWYPAKQRRIAALMAKHGKDLKSLIYNVFVGVAYCIQPVMFTSITGQMASRLGMDEKRDALQTIAELLAVLANTDAFDTAKADRMASLQLLSRIPLSQETVNFIWNSQYLPPMVCKPQTIKKNYDKVYLSHAESMILGPQNHHDGDICLDVLNLVNSVPLKLATDFLCKVEEDPNSEYTIQKAKDRALKKGKHISEAEAAIIVQKQREHWRRFKTQGYEFYKLMAQCGNKFYLAHKYDKRGRLYAMGYHITTQGTSFKKASIELYHEEIVEGVPPEARV